MKRVLTALLTAFTAINALAWVYPEHRDIAILAVLGLDPYRRVLFGEIWSSARLGHESRLCTTPADSAQGRDPACLDWAAWPAIAGDHSCSAKDMLATVLEADWIMDVADVTAELKIGLAEGRERYERINALRKSDILLQGADPKYATRAGSNNVHFLLARATVNDIPKAYAATTLLQGAELNGLGAYTWYHTSALMKASHWNDDNLTAEARAALARAMLADEAFAVHFLEDAFAAGHIAGTWGPASVRKGTHDYYNEKGLAVETWNGDNLVVKGDANMRAEDAERAAVAVRRSLEQLLDAAAGGHPNLQTPEIDLSAPYSLDVCSLATMPVFFALSDTGRGTIRKLAVEILTTTPVPALAEGAGELPRFRAELGTFIGLAPSIGSAVRLGAFGQDQDPAGVSPGMGFAVRFGLGLEGVMNESGDGLVFLDLGLKQDGHSSKSIVESEQLDEYGAYAASIPSRGAYAVRLRLPFWLLPADLLVLGPIMLFVSPEALGSMAVAAGNGGLIPWQAGIATPIGRFQFVLGREVGAAFYGYSGNGDDRLIIPTFGQPTGDLTLIGLRTLQLHFPVIEYRPFRTFSLDQSSSLVFQLGAGIDIPTRVTVIESAGAPVPDLKSVWFLGLRVVFDWRHYF